MRAREVGADLARARAAWAPVRRNGRRAARRVRVARRRRERDAGLALARGAAQREARLEQEELLEDQPVEGGAAPLAELRDLARVRPVDARGARPRAREACASARAAGGRCPSTRSASRATARSIAPRSVRGGMPFHGGVVRHDAEMPARLLALAEELDLRVDQLLREAVAPHLAAHEEARALLHAAGEAGRRAEPLEVDRAGAVAEHRLEDAARPAAHRRVGEQHLARERRAQADLELADLRELRAVVVARRAGGRGDPRRCGARAARGPPRASARRRAARRAGARAPALAKPGRRERLELRERDRARRAARCAASAPLASPEPHPPGRARRRAARAARASRRGIASSLARRSAARTVSSRSRTRFGARRIARRREAERTQAPPRGPPRRGSPRSGELAAHPPSRGARVDLLQRAHADRAEPRRADRARGRAQRRERREVREPAVQRGAAQRERVPRRAADPTRRC